MLYLNLIKLYKDTIKFAVFYIFLFLILVIFNSKYGITTIKNKLNNLLLNDIFLFLIDFLIKPQKYST